MWFWKNLIIPAENPTIADIQWHLHSAVLLDASWIDRMDGIDNKEMHLASKSASSGRHKILVRFYLKSDRFGDFWASGRFEGIRSDFGTCRAVVAPRRRRTARGLGSGSGKCKNHYIYVGSWIMLLWNYWKTYIFLMCFNTFELWFSKMLIFR